MFPADWEESFILNLNKGKGGALDHGNYHGLKHTDQAMKLLERGARFFHPPNWWTSTRCSSLLCLVEVQLMPCSLFASCRKGTSLLLTKGSIFPSFTLRKLLIICQERSFGGSWGSWVWMNVLCMSSRACTSMPGASCRAMAKYSDKFGVRVHQGSILSPLLSILLLEASSCKLCTGAPWELLYADDLVVIADTWEECISKLKAWKVGMESKGHEEDKVHGLWFWPWRP